MKTIIPALILASYLALSAAPAAASIWTATETGDYYKLVYPVFEGDDPDIKEAINADIYTLASETADANQGESYTTSFHYKLKMENDRYLSLVFLPGGYPKGAIHGMYTGVGVVYDKTTGEQLPLSYFADVTLDDLIRLWEEGEFYHYEGKKISAYSLFGPPKRVPKDYFLTYDGKIFVTFGPYELGPYSQGITAINVTSLKNPGVFEDVP